jgi:hypothetical protein
MSPCMPKQNDNGSCQLNNGASSGCRPDHFSSASLTSPHSHIVSGLAIAACRRGVVWSRRCRAHVSIGGLLTTVVGRHQLAHRSQGCSSRGRRRSGAEAPPGEVVL